jgi:alpha-L-fucosidase
MRLALPRLLELRKRHSQCAGVERSSHSQVRELMTNYGRIDELFYDGHMLNHENHLDPNSPSQGFWEPAKLNAMVRDLQPHIIINNRAGSNEDLDTPEQHVTLQSRAAAGKPT